MGDMCGVFDLRVSPEFTSRLSLKSRLKSGYLTHTAVANGF